MKVLIVDNEHPVCEAIQAMLAAFCPEVSAVETASELSAAFALIRHFQPDLLLLDVELDHGATGFDLLRRLQDPDFELVFITAFDQYAIEAFRHSAIDFLLKPLDPEALAQSVQKAAKNRKNRLLAGQIEFLLARMASPNDPQKRIALKDADHIYYVHPAEILYCEADGVYTRIFTETQKPITVSKNLKEYESLLEPFGFLRTHHSFLVNPGKVARYDKNNETLLLANGHSTPLSHRKKEAVLKALERR
jgi:two-component system, LytTR family, response regulator